MKFFINFSNHDSKKWSNEQKETALKMADEIVDLPFPVVDPDATTTQVKKQAKDIVETVFEKYGNNIVVMCQGEMTLVYAVVSLLKEAGITVVAACSERNTVETVQPDGSTKKVAQFNFVQFREY